MRILFLVLTLLVSSVIYAASQEQFSFGRFGEAIVYRPSTVRHAVLFFSDENGWSAADATLAQSLADRGILVAGIDTRHYAAELSKPRSKCSYLAGEFEDFSHELQKRFSPERYHLPVLIGVGEGASLVYAVAAQGSPGTFVGTLTLGFHPSWRPPLKLCQSYELHYSVDKKGVATIDPSEQLSTPWIALHAKSDQGFTAANLLEFVKATGTGRAVTLATDDVAVKQAQAWRDAVVANTEKLAAPDRDEKVYSDELRDLPLEEVRAKGTPTTRMAIFLTGDGGWASIDKGISTQLAERGVDVVALSSLQYFWKPRSPQQTANDVARVLRHYLTAWNKREVVVVGYSFGADVAAFVVNRLPTELRARVISVNLLGLASTADFEVHVTTWLGVDHHGLKTQPEVERLAVPVLCVYGSGETDTVCLDLKAASVQAVKIGEGHHFSDRYQEIADKVLSFADSR